MRSVVQNIPLTLPNGISLFIKREDCLHPFISGNKYRKLKYNIQHIQHNGIETLVTFGGAFSNHIAATAYACKQQNINSVGVIRGEELWQSVHNNPTLRFAQKCGMKFEFVTREQYRDKYTPSFLSYLQTKYAKGFILPEGGTNALAIQGCQEILNQDDFSYHYICAAVGTGGTLSGIINSSYPHQKVLGFPALKGEFLEEEIKKNVQNDHWELIKEYHFGGYAKVTDELIHFLNDFYNKTNIPLDPIYTGKLMYGVLDMVHHNYFPENTKILLIHTGGLQGIEGMNKHLQKKNKPLITYKYP